MDEPTTDLKEIDASDDVSLPLENFEYLDHTADVQIHSWGATLSQAFEQCAVGMFGYMTDLSKVNLKYKFDIEVTGENMDQLLYNFLDEILFMFTSEMFLICRKVKILEFISPNESNEEFRIKATCYGDKFDLTKHTQGTEVKAITYASMQILQADDRCDLYVIVDI